MQKYKGAILIALSALFFSTYGLWSRMMIGSFGEFSQAWTRALILLVILIPFGIYTNSFRRIVGGDLKWFIVIGLCGGLNQAPYYFGFEHLDVGTATLIFYTMLTIGAYVYGKIFFSESLNRSKYTSLILAVIGLGVIYPIVISNSTELLAALTTSVAGMMGAYVVFSKKLSGEYSETQILTTIFVAMLIGNGALSFTLGDSTPVLTELSPWIGQVAYALSMLAANAFVIAGFKYIEPSVGGIIGLLEVVFAIIIGILLFSESLTLIMWGGVFLILFAITLPLLKEHRKVSN